MFAHPVWAGEYQEGPPGSLGRLGFGSRDGNILGVAPKTFEVVECAGFLGKDVDQVVAKVHEDPFGVGEPLDTNRILAAPLQLRADLFADGLNLARVGAGADDEEIGKRGDFAKVEDAYVGGLLRIGGADGGEPGRCLRRRGCRNRGGGITVWSNK